MGEGGRADIDGFAADLGQAGGRHVAKVSGDVLTTDRRDYVSWASVGELAFGKKNDLTVGDGVSDEPANEKSTWCNGGWGELPDICRCGVLRMCRGCAEVAVAAGAVVDAVAEPASSKTSMGEGGGEDGDSREDVMVDMVRPELQRMTETVEQMSSLE